MTVGFLGRLHPKKNVPIIIRAIALSDDVSRLRIAGEGPDVLRRALLTCAAQSGIDDRVEWLGFVTRDKRSAFLLSVDVLVLASEYECFGVAAAEAMAHGVPVIVSSQTGIAPIVARYRCGIVIEPSAENVAAALHRLAIDRGLRLRMGSQGKIASMRELSMDAYGRAARSYYEQLAAPRENFRVQPPTALGQMHA